MPGHSLPGWEISICLCTNHECSSCWTSEGFGWSAVQLGCGSIASFLANCCPSSFWVAATCWRRIQEKAASCRNRTNNLRLWSDCTKIIISNRKSNLTKTWTSGCLVKVVRVCSSHGLRSVSQHPAKSTCRSDWKKQVKGIQKLQKKKKERALWLDDGTMKLAMRKWIYYVWCHKKWCHTQLFYFSRDV